MTSRISIALALAGALSTAAACGGGPQPPRGGLGPGGRGGPAGGFSGLIAPPAALLFSDFDADRDRRVARSEVEAGASSAWASLDRDGDGAASALEYADWARLAMGSENATPGRIAMDSNADGSISPAELRAGLLVEFDRLDANRDGVLERREMVRMIERGGVGAVGGPEADTLILRRGPGGDRGGGAPSSELPGELPGAEEPG